jgi:hypothetical protein
MRIRASIVVLATLGAMVTCDDPGCYAYQVDGATFSETIVFEAVEAN